jgi:hypothetical protein
LTELPEIHSLWIGPRLSCVELVSLCSWVAQGHTVTLWCYEPIEGVPNGVHVADAAKILPKIEITRHRKTGSVSLFSNRFRYHLLQREPAIWADTDVVLLQPLKHSSPYLFGWETSTSICSAVMGLPSTSPVLQELIQLIESCVPVPRWWPVKKKVYQRVAALVGRHRRPEDLAWGTFGSAALTHTLLRWRVASFALPIEAFYPINWTEVALFFSTPDAVSSRLTKETFGVHLWSNSITNGPDAIAWRHKPPPANSWLGAMCQRYNIAATVA